MPNWYDSVEAAAEDLARTAAAARRAGGLVKRAGPLDSAMSWYGRQDAGTQQLLRNGLGGAALGGIGGGLMGYRDREKRNPLTTALTGALAGGAVGAGGTMAWNAMNQKPGVPADIAKLQELKNEADSAAANQQAREAARKAVAEGKLEVGKLPGFMQQGLHAGKGALQGLGERTGLGPDVLGGGPVATGFAAGGTARGAWKTMNQLSANRAQQFMAGAGEAIKNHKFPDVASISGPERLQAIRDQMAPAFNRKLPGREVLTNPGLRSNLLRQQDRLLSGAIGHLQGGNMTSPAAADAITKAMTPVSDLTAGVRPQSLPLMSREDMMRMFQAERSGIEAAVSAGSKGVPSLTGGQIFRNLGRNVVTNGVGGYLLGRGAEAFGGWLGGQMPGGPSSGGPSSGGLPISAYDRNMDRAAANLGRLFGQR